VKVYRIRNKQTGLFLVHQINPNHHGYWNDTGSFWKRIETARRHINDILHEWDIGLSKSGLYLVAENPKVIPEYIGVFEVVVNDITVNGEQIIPAEDIIKEEQKP